MKTATNKKRRNPMAGTIRARVKGDMSAGGWKSTIDADELERNIYADCLISTRSEPRLY